MLRGPGRRRAYPVGRSFRPGGGLLPVGTLFVAFLFLCLLPVEGWMAISDRAFAGTAGAAAPGASASGVVFDNVEGRGRVTIAITGDPRQLNYNSFLLSNPDRLVLDLSGVKVIDSKATIEVTDGIVKRIRINSQFKPGVTRIVIDLTRSAAFHIKAPPEVPNQVVVEFNYQVRDVRFERVDGRPRVIIVGSGPLVPRVTELKEPDRIVVDLPEATIVAPGGPIPVEDDVVAEIRANQFKPDTVRVVAELKEPSGHTVVTSPESPGQVVLDFGVRVVGVRYESGPTSTRAVVSSTGPARVDFTKLSDPDRLILDLKEATLKGDDRAGRTIEIGNGTIDRIRVTQLEPGTVRVIIETPYYVGHSISEAKSPKTPMSPEGTVSPGGPMSPAEITVEVIRSPLLGKTIVLDPGHGGFDPGAVGITGIQEKSITLDIATRLEGLLTKAGAKTLLTRSDDVYVFLGERVRIANEARSDIFVSIHANSYTDLYPSGTETFYFSSVPGGDKLAKFIQEALVRETRLPDRKARLRELYVLKETRMPSTLVEVAFLSNIAEEMLLADPEFRGRVARGIFEGIKAYFTR